MWLYGWELLASMTWWTSMPCSAAKTPNWLARPMFTSRYVVSASLAISAASADPRSQTPLPRSRSGRSSNWSDRSIEVRGVSRALGGQPTDELRVLAQVGEDAPSEDALGREHKVEVASLHQPGSGLQAGLPAAPRRPHGKRRLVDHQRAGSQPARDVVGGGVHPPEVRSGLGVDEQGDDHDHDFALGDGRGGVSGRTQRAIPDRLGQVLGQVGLTGKRCVARVDGCDRGCADVGPQHGMSGHGELNCEWEADLAQPHDGDLHR